MDVRLSAEQQALRESVARVVERLGPKAVGALDDTERRGKLAAAAEASGWRTLRTPDAAGEPSASGVDAALVAEELGRGLADTAFLGPTLSAELRRLLGAPPAPAHETVALTADLGAPGAAVAIDAAGAVTVLAVRGDAVLEAEAGPALEPVDLTRPSAQVALSSARSVANVSALDSVRWTALGLALTCADLAGTMRGAVELSVVYARERRQYGAPIGSNQAVQHLLADAFTSAQGAHSITLHAAWAVDSLEPEEALAAAAAAKAYCSREARQVCETAIQVHGGLGNTWDCLVHLYLRRALLSIDVLGGIGASLDRVLRHRGSEQVMDFADSPSEAAFRQRLRSWLASNNPGLPTSSTDDRYWVGQAAWHRSLYDAGFFGLSWPQEIGGQGLSSVFDVILDEEVAEAGAPPRPSLGYLVQGILADGSVSIKHRFLPGIVNGRERWCQGFSEPEAGSDLASLRTRAERDGSDYVITGQKVWTSYSDDADWCLLLARTDTGVARHKGISAFGVPMRQPGVVQRPLRMINGITKEFGEVFFDGARVPADNMIGEPGEGWAFAMTVVSHEREPGELGYVARYRKLVNELVARVRSNPNPFGAEQLRELAWAVVEVDMLGHHVARRLSERLDGVTHGPYGSVDKLLMTSTEQTVGHAAVAIGGAGHGGGDQTSLKAYLYSRAQSVMGGTSQIQRNLIARRILDLPTE